MRKHKGLMVALRDRLVEIRPGADEETIQFERIKPRTLILVVAGTIAAYVLLSQLAQVDLVTLITDSDWRWIAAAFLSLLTYFGSAWSLSGFVPEKLRLTTLQAQIAGDFATLVPRPHWDRSRLTFATSEVRPAPGPRRCQRGCVRRCDLHRAHPASARLRYRRRNRR